MRCRITDNIAEALADAELNLKVTRAYLLKFQTDIDDLLPGEIEDIRSADYDERDWHQLDLMLSNVNRALVQVHHATTHLDKAG